MHKLSTNILFWTPLVFRRLFFLDYNDSKAPSVSDFTEGASLSCLALLGQFKRHMCFSQDELKLS